VVPSAEEYTAEWKERGKNQLHYTAYRTPIGDTNTVFNYACYCLSAENLTFRLISSNPLQKHMQSGQKLFCHIDMTIVIIALFFLFVQINILNTIEKQ
jgi:hypothetical protein